MFENFTGYRAYCLLYNSWNDTDERYKEEIELTFKLAKRVIEILDVATVSCKAKELIN